MGLTEKTLAPKMEAIYSIEDFVGGQIDTLLRPVGESWQPSDFLPDLTKEDWEGQVQDLRGAAAGISDELMVVLVGDMVTEEALPTYQTWLNRLQGVTDPSGVSERPWARWSRGWTSEENRHGDLLNKYLYLSGRVDMRSVETTIHHLINNGFDPQTENDPYLGFIYTSFQERATKISHRNVATLAKRSGDETLHRICGVIAGDEARHEKAYKLFMKKIFEIDPVASIHAFALMMRKKIVMPAILMQNGNDDNLYLRFSKVAQRTGVYTAKDYAEIIEDLVEYWGVAALTGLSDLAAEAQEYLCKLATRYRTIAERISINGPDRFSWIFGREVG